MSRTDPGPQTVAFRLLHVEDFPLLHCWLNKEHVRAGWFADGTYPPDGYTLESITHDFSPDLEADSPITPLIIEYGGKPIGYVQVWRVADFPDYAGPFINDDTPPSSVASFDTFIGDEDHVGRGLFPEIVESLLKDHIFSEPCVSCVIINPDSANDRAIRAYERSGFRHTMTLSPAGQGYSSHIMRIDREEVIPE